MFERPHHRRIARAFPSVRIENLKDCGCLFGGGTSLALQLGEYRESVDIDFLCGTLEDFSKIRRGLFDHGQAFLFAQGTVLSREIISSRSEIRCAIDLGDSQTPIKFEILQEGYLGGLRPSEAGICGAPCLHPQDAMAMKLMANADRGLDDTHNFRDLIDLLVAARAFGPISRETMIQVRKAYNVTAEQGLEKTVRLIGTQPRLLTDAFKQLAVTPEVGEYVVETLKHFAISRVIA